MKKLSWKEYLFLGSMLFGLFFGAGNLIFPVYLGQLSGANVSKSNIGFLITAVGLPLLGFISMGVSGKDSLFGLALKVGKRFAYFMTVLLFLTIGPLFALPRLGTTSFEVGFSHYLSESQYQIALVVFIVAFYFIAWYLARRPSKVVDYIGKFLNPLFLALLGMLLVISWIRPMGDISSMDVLGEAYERAPVISGFLAGYETLDACGSLAFGTLIITTMRRLELKENKEIVFSIGISGLVMAFLMIVIYTSLSYMGARSLGILELSENGGIALGQISRFYLGRWGFVILASTITVACLKTAIGLISSFGQNFMNLFPKGKYSFFIAFASIISTLIGTLGLSQILNWSLPVLFFIYPLAIVLIILPFIELIFGESETLYKWSIYTTIPFAFLDALRVTPEVIQNTKFVQSLISFSDNTLPLYDLGLGWMLFAALGIIVGLIITKVKD